MMDDGQRFWHMEKLSQAMPRIFFEISTMEAIRESPEMGRIWISSDGEMFLFVLRLPKASRLTFKNSAFAIIRAYTDKSSVFGRFFQNQNRKLVQSRNMA
jgi:hypothetical protein